jgi:hypothetical protein
MKKVGLADWRTSNGLPSVSDPETEADRTPRESLLTCMTANCEPSNQSALKLTGRRRFALRAVASCRFIVAHVGGVFRLVSHIPVDGVFIEVSNFAGGLRQAPERGDLQFAGVLISPDTFELRITVDVGTGRSFPTPAKAG